jgi:hypothetical protein
MKTKLGFLLISFGILMGGHLVTMMVISGSLPEAKDILGSVVFGLVLAFVFTELQAYFASNGKTVGFQPHSLSPKQQVKIAVRGEVAKILHQVKEGLTQKKWELVAEDTQRGELEFRTGVSWKSWGEVVYVQAMQKEDNEVDIDICSLPSWRTTMVDYGKNQENIREVERILRKK